MSNAKAPFIYFDGIGASGISEDGTANITLVAARFMPDPKGGAGTEIVATAHLRFGRKALAQLREAIDRMEGRPAIKVVAN